MLDPRCGECGGLLESFPAGSPAADVAALRIDPFRGRGPTLSPAFGRLLRFALVGLLMFAAARVGWSAGGPALAIAAIGMVGLFSVPLIVGE